MTPALKLLIQPREQQLSVLFFGNSFTYGEDGQPNWVSVPDVFQALARASGRRVTVGMQASPGQSFHFHLNPALASTIALLQQRRWTHVVIQNKVSEASHIGWEPDFHTLGAQFYDLIQAHRPKAKVRLYEGWAYGAENSKMTGVSDATHFLDPQEMLDEIAANHVTLRDTLNSANPSRPPVEIVPVGQFMRSTGADLPTSHPDYQNFWAPNQPTDDWIHGNRPWYFAAGCCFFANILGIDPTPFAAHAALALGIDMTGHDPEEIATLAWNFISAGAYPPIITADPEDATITEGGTGNFSVTAMGNPLAYQWRVDGVNEPGATASTFNYLSEDGEGGTAPEIDVVVSNSLGSKTSVAAALTIEEAAPEGPYASTGGTITEAGGYRIHTFTASGDIVFDTGGDVEYLIVAGGGGGGGASGGSNSGGGGGGGGVRSGTTSVTATTLAVVIGAGGAGGTTAPTSGSAGGNSSFNSIVSTGGGFGGERFTNGGSGGSGGGSGALASTGGAGTAGQGFAGANVANGQAGGGGGASEVGESGLVAGAPVEGTSGSAGGDGVASSISGSSVTYGGGGGGGTAGAGGSGRSSFGGAGGGGKGSNQNGPTTVPQSGTNGLGGGGGGAGQATNAAGGTGGTGVVIIRYPI